jgi:hypothetical protein
VYGQQGCPDWGTTFAEMEADAREVGHEFIRLLMEQAAGCSAAICPQRPSRAGAKRKSGPFWN